MKRILAALLLAAMAMCVLCSCASPEEQLVGTWKRQDTVLGVVTETKYTFNEDGTGTRSGIIGTDFSYTIDGDKLILTAKVFGIDTGTETYSYKINGKKLLMTRDGETLELEKAD